MAIKITLESFLAVLRRSNLVEAEQIKRLTDEFRATHGEPADAKPFADFLVQQKQITAWQADKLLMGKHKGFFLGRYKLKGLLGKGGMSSVYLAEHVLMRRMCALKVLPARRVNDASYLGRFHREAQAVAALDHPNIVRAYDVDHEEDGEFQIHFLVMEYVEGKSLLDLVAEKGLAKPTDAADYVRQAALGLDHAHRAGIIHRDIKPGNLLLDSNGTIKLLDMGLARFFGGEDKESLTIQHDEKVLGTADYLAPEQAVDSHKVDRRADIYSLGCSLYFLLTGHPPFNTGSLAQRLMAHQMKEPPPVTTERSDVPESLLAIMKKMMAKQPEQRYATAGEAADALGDWLGSQGFTVARVSDSGRHRAVESSAAAAPEVAAPPVASASVTPPPAPAPVPPVAPPSVAPAAAPAEEEVPAFLNFGSSPPAESAPVEFPNFFDQPVAPTAPAPAVARGAATPAKGTPAVKPAAPAKPTAKAAPAAPPKAAPAKAVPKPSTPAPAPADDVPAFMNFGGGVPAEESAGFPQLFDDPAPAPALVPSKPAPAKPTAAAAKAPATTNEEVPAFLAMGGAAAAEPSGFPSMFDETAPPSALSPPPPPPKPAPVAKAPAKPAPAPPAPTNDVPDFLNFGGDASPVAEEAGGMPDLFGSGESAPPPAAPPKPAPKPPTASPKAAAPKAVPAKTAPQTKPASKPIAAPPKASAPPAVTGDIPDFLAGAGSDASSAASESPVGDLFGFNSPSEAAPQVPSTAPPPPPAAKPAPAKPAAAKAPAATPLAAAEELPAFLGGGDAAPAADGGMGDLFGIGAEPAPTTSAPPAPAPSRPATSPPKTKPAPPKPAAKPVVAAAAAPAAEELPFFAQEGAPAAGDDPFGFADSGASPPAPSLAETAVEESNPFAGAPAATASPAAPPEEVPGFLAAASAGPDETNPFAMGETSAVATAPPRTTAPASRPLKTGTGARGNLAAEVQAWLQVKRNQAIAGGAAAGLLVLVLAVAFWPKGAAPGKATAANPTKGTGASGGDLPAAATAAGSVARPKPQGDTYTVGPTGNFGTVTEAVNYFLRNASPDGARRTIRVTGGYWYGEAIAVGGVGISSPLTIVSDGETPAVLRPAGGKPILNIPLATGLVLENIVLDANGAQVCGQIESLGAGSRLSNVEFKNFRDFGLVITSVPGDAMQPVQIENCRFVGRDAASKGLVFKTAPDNLFGLTIHQCQFQAPLRTGIEFGSHAVWNVTVSQCRFVDVKTGLSFPAAKQDIADLHILNNTFYRSQDGIVFNQAPAGNAQGMQSAVIGNLFASTAVGGGDLVVREGLTAPVWTAFTKGGPGVAGNMTQREAELGTLEVDIFSTGGGKRGLKELAFESTTPGAAGFLKPTGPQVTFPAPKAGQAYAGAVQP